MDRREPGKAESLWVLVDRKRARAVYALETILSEFAGFELQVTEKIEEFMAADGLRLNYSSLGIPAVFRVQRSDLLFDTDIFEQEIHWGQWQGMPVFFQTAASKAEVGFDLFAASFYLISRYEEYLPFVPDEHGRFPSDQSEQARHELLQRPLVDEWLERMLEVWEQFEGRRFKRAPTEYRFVSTIDVDNAYAFSGKGLLRTLYGFAGDLSRLDWNTLFRRLRVVRGEESDPYDTYDELMTQAEEGGYTLIFFALFSEYAAFDRSLGPHRPAMHKLLRSFSDFAEIGLHPSYASAGKTNGIKAEKEAVEEIVHRRLKKSRQHYLKLRFPETYRRLAEAGISEDYSMGYPKRTGWRMGTCRSVRFYDLELEEATALRLYPFPFMDTVYIDHLRKSPEDALKEMGVFLEQCRRYGGQMVSVFHDRTLSEMLSAWKDWKALYDQWTEMAK